MASVLATCEADYATAGPTEPEARYDTTKVKPYAVPRQSGARDRLFMTAAVMALVASTTAEHPATQHSGGAWTAATWVAFESTRDEDRSAELSSEILSYLRLPDGWDGPGSRPPSREAVEDALAFVDLLQGVQLEPMVSADGEVGFFRRTPDSYIDIGFKGDGRISYFARNQDRRVKGVHPYGRRSVPKDLLKIIAAA